MKRPIVNKCCCCCSLSGGAQLLGWLNVVGGLFSVISVIASLTNFDGVLDVFNDGTFTQDEFEYFKTIYRASLIVSLVTNLVLVAFAVCLILGAKRNNERLILPWLIANMLSIVLYGILTIVIVVAAGLLAIIFFAILAFQIYLWICVYSLYRDIVVKRAMAQNQNAGNVAAPYPPGWIQPV